MQIINNLLPYIQLVLSIVLAALVLLQQSEGSLGSAFGGGESSGAFHKKRGLEKMVFNATVLVACLFVLSTILALFV